MFSDFDSWLKACQSSWGCPGVVVIAESNGERIVESAHGYANVDAQTPVTLETTFPVASVTKTIASLVAVLLVEDGFLTLDSSIQDNIPEFRLADEYASRHVSLRDILSHQLGMPRYTLTSHGVDTSLEEYVAKLVHMPLSSNFRSGYSYSNAMYIVLGYIIEKLTGRRWGSFVQERILDPLQLYSSGFLPDILPVAKGYMRVQALGGKFKTEPASNIPSTKLSPGLAGGFVSNALDLSKLMNFHLTAYNESPAVILNKTLLANLHTPQVVVPTSEVRKQLQGNVIDTYALGWRVESYNSARIISHGGLIEGFRSIVGFLPDYNASIVVQTNVAGTAVADVVFYEIVDRLTGNKRVDRNKQYHAILDPLYLKQSAKRVSHQKLTQDLAPNAIGDFVHPAYPTFQIQSCDDRLTARLGSQCPWGDIEATEDGNAQWFYAPLDCWVNMELTGCSKDNPVVSLKLESALAPLPFVKTAQSSKSHTL